MAQKPTFEELMLADVNDLKSRVRRIELAVYGLMATGIFGAISAFTN